MLGGSAGIAVAESTRKIFMTSSPEN